LTKFVDIFDIVFLI